MQATYEPRGCCQRQLVHQADFGGEAPASTPHPRAASPQGTIMDVEAVDRAPSRGPYPLQGWLFCVCGQAFLRSDGTGSTRGYLSLCGCRLWPIDADTVEQLVDAEVAGMAAGLIGDGGTGYPAEVFTRLFLRIEVGGTVDDIRFVLRA